MREVFEVSLDDIAEVHLHPGDMRAAIVSLSQPKPRFLALGGADWQRRSAPLRITGATIAVAEAAVWPPLAGRTRRDPGMWAPPSAESDRGLMEIAPRGSDRATGAEIDLGGVGMVMDEPGTTCPDERGEMERDRAVRGPEDVAVLTLNRPDRLNAWIPEMQTRYFDLLEECASRADVRAIVVTGAGRGFCAGADMEALQQLAGDDGEATAGRPDSRPVTFPLTIPKPDYRRHQRRLRRPRLRLRR